VLDGPLDIAYRQPRVDPNFDAPARAVRQDAALLLRLLQISPSRAFDVRHLKRPELAAIERLREGQAVRVHAGLLAASDHLRFSQFLFDSSRYVVRRTDPVAMTQRSAPLRATFQTHIASKSPITRGVYLRGLQHFENWADQSQLDLVELQTKDLERFLTDQGRRYANATLQVRCATLRAFYHSLMQAGLVQDDPTTGLHLSPIENPAALGPVAYLTDEEVARLKESARQLGAVHSLAICMLHQTPISVSRVACLAITDFAEDPQGRSFAVLGRTPTTQTPWRIGQQAREAVNTLKNDQPRLISPHTKNPNLLLVRAAIEQTRIAAGIQTPKLGTALQNARRRDEHELCARFRLEPDQFRHYQRRLLRKLTPLVV
jgi:site-specific recombinase XerD